MHSKDPQEKYLAATSREEIDASKIGGRTCFGAEGVERGVRRRGHRGVEGAGGGRERKAGTDARHHRIQKVGYDRLLMRALPGGLHSSGSLLGGVYQVGCQGNGGGLYGKP